MFKRLLFWLVIFAGASASVPPLRARVAPQVAPIWAAVVERLGPPIQRRLEPLRHWTARKEMRQLGRLLQQQDVTRTPLPTPRQFPGYVERTGISSRGALDPWGVPYHLIIKPDSLIIVSAGPDLKRGTPDDLREAAARK